MQSKKASRFDLSWLHELQCTFFEILKKKVIGKNVIALQLVPLPENGSIRSRGTAHPPYSQTTKC